MGVEFEHGELDRLGVDLDAAAREVIPEVRKVVQKGALNIKTDARRRVGGLAHAPSYPSAITYDSVAYPTGAAAEIGPEKSRRQGALGNLLEYGSVHNAPIPHMAPAADAELPRFERAIEDLGVRAVEQ